jgi:hypothetical protein
VVEPESVTPGCRVKSAEGESRTWMGSSLRIWGEMLLPTLASVVLMVSVAPLAETSTVCAAPA